MPHRPQPLVGMVWAVVESQLALRSGEEWEVGKLSASLHGRTVLLRSDYHFLFSEGGRQWKMPSPCIGLPPLKKTELLSPFLPATQVPEIVPYCDPSRNSGSSSCRQSPSAHPEIQHGSSRALGFPQAD